VLGIGAGWYEKEHQAFGLEFGSFSERFERLEESLQIVGPMLRGEQPTFTGSWYQVQDAMNNPRLRPTIPIMLGGSGEQKTFRMAARYADHMNIICGRPDVPRKVAALRERCEEIGRDPASLPTSYLAMVVLTDSAEQTRALLEQVPPDRRERVFLGTPEEVAGTLKADVLDHGIDGLTVNLMRNGHVPGAVAALGKALLPLLS
jgi:alkanesulfonate monooxygenase SsuD/methylene tetrahydromethanopterin reductase-like flavin-dependent oxidoreductase (luciferase family)